MTDSASWIDLSVPLRSGMAHWPGDPEPNFERISDMEQGADVNVTFCRMTAHTVTHMDAPCHFVKGGTSIDTFPIHTGIGEACVVELSRDCQVVRDADLRDKGIQRGDRVLLKTRNSETRWANADFHSDYVALDLSGAHFLVEAGVALVGVDYLSVGVFDGDGPATHRALMQAGIWIVEGLDLSRVTGGRYDLVCLPLRLQGADGAPARVVARRI